MPDEITFKPRTAANRHVEDQATIDALRARVAELEIQNLGLSEQAIKDRREAGELRARVAELEAGISAIAYLNPERATIQEAIEIAAPLVSHP